MALKRADVEYSKEYAPEVTWPNFLRGLHSEWEAGQHLSALGRTGGGKTTMLTQVLDDRRYVVVLLTKLRDPLFPLLSKRGYKTVHDLGEWPDRQWFPKVAIHLPSTEFTREANNKQSDKIRRVLHKVWRDGDCDLYIDEVAELSDLLNLKLELRALYKEARSSGVSIVAGTQRQAWVPKEMYDQSRFVAFWRTSNRENMKRMADLNGVDPEPVRAIVAQLGEHEILMVDTITGELVRTTPPKLK